MYMGVSETWVLCGRGLTKGVVPFHLIVDVLGISVIGALPAIHAVTGCDTTNWDEESCSKVRRNRQNRDADLVWKRTFNVGCH